MKEINVDVYDIKVGDTIVDIDGRMVTVGKNDLKNSFHGLCLRGYPYTSKGEKVKKVLFPVWYQGEIIRYE